MPILVCFLFSFIYLFYFFLMWSPVFFLRLEVKLWKEEKIIGKKMCLSCCLHVESITSALFWGGGGGPVAGFCPTSGYQNYNPRFFLKAITNIYDLRPNKPPKPQMLCSGNCVYWFQFICLVDFFIFIFEGEGHPSCSHTFLSHSYPKHRGVCFNFDHT